jgi:hypothetical protein
MDQHDAFMNVDEFDSDWYHASVTSNQRTEAACVNVQGSIQALQQDLILFDKQERLQQALLTTQLQEQLRAQNLRLQREADVKKVATVWLCPVCNEQYQSMRTYKFVLCMPCC